MNKRIKELSTVARHWAHFDGLAQNPTSSPDILFEQKFAELIMQECANHILDSSDRYRKEYFANKVLETFNDAR